MKADAADHHVAPAELPSQVKALIAKVVKRTRLRKAERTDIERELAAHFRDGLASGKSVEQLVDAFGEPKVSAKNIRAGAIARRSPLDRALRQASFIVGGAFIACVVLYGGSIGYLWLQAPVIRFDALERYHAALPKVASQDRAWPVYKQGLIALADTAEDKSSGHYSWGSQRSESKALAFHSYGEERLFAIPNQESWVFQSNVLRKRRDGIEMLVRASSMPALGYVPSYYANNIEDDDIGYYYPHDLGNEPRYFGQLGLIDGMMLRSATRFLGADAFISIEDGDGDRFVRNIEAIIRVSHHVEEAKFTVSQLCGTAIRDAAFTRIIMALEWRPESLSDEQLKRLAELLGRIQPSDAEIDLTIEPLGMQDFVQHVYTDNGSGDGVFNPVYGSAYLRLLPNYPWPLGVPPGTRPDLMDRAFRAPAGALTNATRKEVTDLHDAMMQKTQEQAKRPLWQQDFSFENDFVRTLWGDDRRRDWGDYYSYAKDHDSGPSKWTIPRLLLHGYSKAVMTRTMGRGQLDAARVAVALVRYRRAHMGVWPARLEELVPQYLDAVPPDPWTGAPIHYAVKDGRAEVWSEGSRGKFSKAGDAPTTSKWMHEAGTNSGDRWLWFSSDDKLERWKEGQ